MKSSTFKPVLRVQELPPSNIGIIPNTLLLRFSTDHFQYISELLRGSREDQSCDTSDFPKWTLSNIRINIS